MSKKDPKHKIITKQLQRDYLAVRVFSKSTHKAPLSWLYRIVYKSALSALLVFVLMVSFLLQGVHVVFANVEEVPEAFEPKIVEITEGIQTIANESPPVTEPLKLPDKSQTFDDSGPELSLAIEVNEPETGDFLIIPSKPTALLELEVVPEWSTSSESEVPTPNTLDTTDFGEGRDVTGLTGSTTEESTIEEEVQGVGDSELDSINANTDEAMADITDVIKPEEGGNLEDETKDEIESTTDFDLDAATSTLAPATTTQATSSNEVELLGPVQDVAINTNFSDGAFTFTKDECTELSSGSYYCLPPQLDLLNDALFAAPDADGDLEIFLVRDGVQTQVTQNLVDDASPFYDQNSESIVWHRLVDDRYQIIVYDLQSGEETQLTRGSSNNMEPNRQGKYLVWQKWTDNNWDIMLFDGKEDVQITNSSAHDIAPYIHGSLVVWNRHTVAGDKTIEMYDIKAETYVTVEDSAGLSVANPRMVLVYDQLHPNGDIVTRGYDMLTRQFIQLGTLPRQLPDDIPESEPTSETRALIQSKPSVKSDDLIAPEVTPEIDPPLPPGLDLSSSTLDLTINMKDHDNIATSAPAIAISDFDLVIESFSPETPLNSGAQD